MADGKTHESLAVAVLQQCELGHGEEDGWKKI